MDRHDADVIAATEAADRHELVSLMEPLTVAEAPATAAPSPIWPSILPRKSAGFRRSLPPSLLSSLATLVRAMNCYYSNLIEGHDTHPVDIERALKNDYSQDARKRDLQLEAKAHIAVQQWIDDGGLKGRAVDGGRHPRNPSPFLRAAPGRPALRRRPAHEGAHPGRSRRIAPPRCRGRAPPRGQPRRRAALPASASRKSMAASARPRPSSAAAAAHHRLLWIHPFLDGNGRVARLMSHAILLETLDTGAVWSVARGLARNVAGLQATPRQLRPCRAATISTGAGI